MHDLLPEDRLAWFILDVVGQTSLSAFEAKYRVDGRGVAAFLASAMVLPLSYAYCKGVRSGRRMVTLCERGCTGRARGRACRRGVLARAAMPASRPPYGALPAAARRRRGRACACERREA